MAVSNDTRLNGGEPLPQKQTRATGTEFTAALEAAKARAAPVRPAAGRPGSLTRDARSTGRDALSGCEGLADEKLYGFRVHSGSRPSNYRKKFNRRVTAQGGRRSCSESFMYSLAIERSRWLAELAQAVDDAQQLLRELPSWFTGDDEALDLSARLASVAGEIERLRRARGESGDASPAPQARRMMLL